MLFEKLFLVSVISGDPPSPKHGRGVGGEGKINEFALTAESAITNSIERYFARA
jgi:hypothetical protein